MWVWTRSFSKPRFKLVLKYCLYGVWPHTVIVIKNSETSNLNSTSRLCDTIGMIVEEVKWVFLGVISTSLVADLIKDAYCPSVS